MYTIQFNLNFALGFLIIVARVFSETNTRTTQRPMRIVGGMDIPPGRYIPYQISLQYRMPDTEAGEAQYKHFCGGSIISATHILTAAHCCVGFNVSRMSVLAGVRDLRDPLGERYAVDNYKIHTNYTELQTNDIAIIKLMRPLNIDGVRMATVDVSGKERLPSDIKVILTGWGLRAQFPLPPLIPLPFLEDQLNSIIAPNILQIASFTTISDSDCKLVIEQLTETEICAGGEFLSGACMGDSGGPLVMVTENGIQQVGIVSYGLFICGIFNPVVPDVYTRVSEFTDWIQKMIAT